jgi:hypothetical protein
VLAAQCIIVGTMCIIVGTMIFRIKYSSFMRMPRQPEGAWGKKCKIFWGAAASQAQRSLGGATHLPLGSTRSNFSFSLGNASTIM